MNDTLMSRKQIAEFLGVSVSTVKRWELEKDFPEPTFKHQRTLRYARTQVIEFVKRNELRTEVDDGRP